MLEYVWIFFGMLFGVFVLGIVSCIIGVVLFVEMEVDGFQEDVLIELGRYEFFFIKCLILFMFLGILVVNMWGLF